MFNELTALYIEDEDQIKNLVIKIIGNFFKKFITAGDGKEGLKLFLEYKDDIDIVITDINMPKMNGLDMCRKIRELKQSIPIIITTAHNDNDFLHQAINIGIAGYVTKPMDLKQLIEVIKKSVEPIILRKKLEEETKAHQEERLAAAKFTAIGQLAAGITHEINTPLTYIKASFEMMEYDIEKLSDTSIKENMLKDCIRINDGIRRIANIVESMKEMSQQSRVTKEKTNIYATIVTSAIMAYNRAKHISHIYINGREFDLDMDKDEFSFIANVQKQRVEQVWIIIINNAMDELIKIKDFNGRRLDIMIEEIENGVKVLFKDNAGGIKEEVFDSLFEPFKGTKESSGMGVGLSIAKRIINDQNGIIKAYNEEDGAVFEVLL